MIGIVFHTRRILQASPTTQLLAPLELGLEVGLRNLRQIAPSRHGMCLFWLKNKAARGRLIRSSIHLDDPTMAVLRIATPSVGRCRCRRDALRDRRWRRVGRVFDAVSRERQYLELLLFGRQTLENAIDAACKFQDVHAPNPFVNAIRIGSFSFDSAQYQSRSRASTAALIVAMRDASGCVPLSGWNFFASSIRRIRHS